MALTQAQRDAIYADIILGNLDDYASNPDSLIEVMSSEEFKQGLTCGQLSLEKLNYLFAFTMLSIQKALAESKAYAEGLTTALANALNFCNALSPRAGNLLRTDLQPDGSCKFYYGTEPPQNLRNQYVDYANGSDANPGTRASPLKTIAFALSRLDYGTTGNIHLHESGSHIWDSESSWAKGLVSDIGQSANFFTYGSNTDSAQATWNSGLNGWGWYGWVNSPRATIQFVANHPRDSVAYPSAMIATSLIGSSVSKITFKGIRMITGNLSTDIHVPVEWKSIFRTSGALEFTDCIIDNQGAPLVGSDAGHNFTATVHSTLLLNANGAIFHLAKGKGEAFVYSRTPGQLGAQGLEFNAGSPNTAYSPLVIYKLPAQTVSPNFSANF